MQSKILLRRSLFIVGVAGVIFSSAAIFFMVGGRHILQGVINGETVEFTTQNTALREQTTSEFPIRLKIPRIRVDAPVEQVGVIPGGIMGAPKGPDSVAWFNLGPRPGEKGSAVVAGHSGWKEGIPAAFDNLYKLRKGDRIFVEDGQGGTATFVVRELRTYDPKVNDGDVFGSNDGKAHLNLITCEGVWNSVSRSFSERLVVFTDKE